MGALVYSQSNVPGTQRPLSLTFRACTRAPKTLQEEAYAAARAIAQSAQKPIVLCFSGGLDSEIMCRAFFDQGINMSVLTIEHSKGANAHGVDHARKWCWERGIPHEVLPLDTKRFIEKDVDVLADGGFISNNIMRYFELFLLSTAEKSGKYAVIGDGAPIYRGDPQQAETYVRFGQGDEGLERWSTEPGSGHEPFFFRSTPELWAAHFNVPIVSYATQSPNLFYNAYSGQSFKRFIHHAEWPDVSARPYYTPFGSFRALRLKKETELRKRFVHTNPTHDVAVRDIMQALAPHPDPSA